MSKRNYKRLVKKQSNLYKNRANAEQEIIAGESHFSDLVEHEQCCEKFKDFEFVDLPTPTLNSRENLMQLYIETSPIVHQRCLSCEEILQQFHTYKESSERQFNTLLEILGEHKVLLERIVSQNAVVSNIMNIFPITSEEKLKELDVLLTTQYDPYMRQIKTLLGGNAERNLHQIFGYAIIMDFNVDGTFGKKRLRDYANVFRATIDAISSFTDSSDKCLRAAFQRQKKKYFKQSSRSKATNNSENNVEFAE